MEDGINNGGDGSIPVAYAYAVTAPVKGKESMLNNGPTGSSSSVSVPETTAPTTLSPPQIQALVDQGFTRGLIQAILENNLVFPLRIWVVDNSGSMLTQDGHKIIETLRKDKVKLVDCSRWAEIQETVNYHARMAALLQAPTVFRLLNNPGRAIGPQQLSIAERGPDFVDNDLQLCLNTMRAVTPSGVTPLAQHVHEIRENVIVMRDDLLRQGTKIAIVLATDGLPTDGRGFSNSATRGEFERALRTLEGLPVWIVIRLCTDEESVVDYYNNLDSQLELSLEVLDDFMGEAKEVYEFNNWLNYALPMHRIREMGFNNRLFDLLDERKFTLDEVGEFLRLIFGHDAFDGVPDPQLDFDGFLNSMSIIVQRESKQWNPMTKRMEPWIDMRKLKKTYSTGGCCVM